MATQRAPSTLKPPRSAVEMSGSVKAGVLYVDDKRQLLHDLQKLPDDCRVVLRIDPEAEVRSLALNARYFSTLRDIATHLNENEAEAKHTTDALHVEYKARFNGGASTTTLSPPAFATYLLRVMAHAGAEYGVEFPEPEAVL